MSYNIVGKFFLNGKPVITSDFSILKSINGYRYTLSLTKVESINFDFEKLDLSDPFFEKNGMVFNKKSFEDALEIYELHYKNKYDKLQSLKSMKDSIEFYKLPSEGRNEIEQNIEDYTELLEDLKYQVSSVNKVIGMFDLVESMFVDDKWNYSSDVMLYLEAN